MMSRMQWSCVLLCVLFWVALHILIVTMDAVEYNNMKQYQLSVPVPNTSNYNMTLKKLQTCNVDAYGYTDFAFVSMITSEGVEGLNDLSRYVKSAAKLGTSIKQWTNLDTVIMVVGSSPLSAQHHITLTQAGWIVCYVNSIENPNSGVENRFLHTKMYSKLNVWSLVEYKAVVMVDSDILCLRDPISLFTGVYTHMKQFGYHVAAAVDVPKVPTSRCNYETDKYNAGVLVLMPNMSLFVSMKDSIYTLHHNYEHAEQAFLNSYFKDQVYPLQYRYNANIAAPFCEPELWFSEQEHIVFVHYTILKPWIYSEQYVIWIIEKLKWNSPGYMYMLWEQARTSQVHGDLYNI